MTFQPANISAGTVRDLPAGVQRSVDGRLGPILGGHPIPSAGTDRPASGNVDPGPGRQRVAGARTQAGRQASTLRRCAARNAGRPCGRRDFRWSNERERPRRIRSSGDRLDRRAAQGTAAIPGNLPGCADARHATRRPRRAASARPRGNRVLPDPPHARGASRFAGIGPIMSTSGIAKDLNFPQAPNYWRKGTICPCRRSGPETPSASSFILT